MPARFYLAAAAAAATPFFRELPGDSRIGVCAPIVRDVIRDAAASVAVFAVGGLGETGGVGALRQLLERDDSFAVLDGGLGTLLEQHGHDVAGSLWSARLLIDAPEAIVAAHAEYFAAGAQVAISASYQASFEGFAALGLDSERAAALMGESVRLARVAAGGPGGHLDDSRDALIAASLGPYGAHLADGSEYRGDYGLDVAALRAWHQPRVDALLAADPHAIAAETIPSLAEVEAVVAAVSGTGVDTWISVTPSMGRMRTGESLAEAFAIAASAPEVVAVGVNCCHPSEVLPAIDAAATTGLPFIAYPNSGEEWDAKNRVWVEGTTFPPDLVAQWCAAGARLIGGCCRVGPADIAAIAALR